MREWPLGAEVARGDGLGGEAGVPSPALPRTSEEEEEAEEFSVGMYVPVP